MDNRSNPTSQDTSAPGPTGCCGGKGDAKPQAEVEPRVAETAKDKPVSSGCCCGQN